LEVQESQLVGRVAGGDDTALRALFEAHGEAVFRYAYRRLGSSYEDAEEVTVDTFLTARELAASYLESGTVRAWLYGIARLRVIDKIRLRGRGKRIPDGRLSQLSDAEAQVLKAARQGKTPLDEAIEWIDLEWLTRVMGDCLLEDERDALMLLYVEGASLEEISIVQGRSVKGVKNVLHRAKRKMREELSRLEVEA
jgi:RNA polymerase sigma-70 factor (ECF subfamily)